MNCIIYTYLYLYIGSYPTRKGRGSIREDLPLIRGKEQWLNFPGAALKRDLTSKVDKPK